jgi:hypothetical protein
MMHVTQPPFHAFKTDVFMKLAFETMMRVATSVTEAPEPHAACSMDLAERQPYTVDDASEQSLG